MRYVENGGTHKGDEQMSSEPMTGRMIEANFESDTLTFEMDRGYYASAGRYVIVRERDYTDSAEHRAELLRELQYHAKAWRDMAEEAETGEAFDRGQLDACNRHAAQIEMLIANATQQRNATGGEA